VEGTIKNGCFHGNILCKLRRLFKVFKKKHVFPFTLGC